MHPCQRCADDAGCPAATWQCADCGGEFCDDCPCWCEDEPGEKSYEPDTPEPWDGLGEP
jgi:hypothetical protein